MSMKLKYINSAGTELNLNESPYFIDDNELFGYSWDIDSSNKGDRAVDISRFRRNGASKSATLYVLTKTAAEFNSAMNAFFETVEYDVVNKTPGKLVLNDGAYIKCYVTESSNARIEYGRVSAEKGITFYFTEPFWTKSVTKTFTSWSVETDGLNYPFNYPFNYSGNAWGDEWVTGVYLPSDFIMTISGAASNPQVYINEYSYKVFTTLLAGENLVINSKDRTVIKYGLNGVVTNCYNSRQFVPSIFEKMPGGILRVQWNGDFTFQIELLSERSEPKWNCS